ncbi:hypothetical protein ACFXP1_39070, partial [Streptomyces sp. NPDC059112]|uniref:hypothetical protein n=1 Tax=Streptomyces sp. NPDC059112 TaxID=3346730 RepID=UPI0036CFCA6C
MRSEQVIERTKCCCQKPNIATRRPKRSGHCSGRGKEALPTTDYLNAWAREWIEPAGALESLPSNLQIRLFGNVISRTPEASMSGHYQLLDARRWAAISARVVPASEFRLQWTMLRLGLLRRAGEFEEALRLAGPLADIQDWFTAVGRGLVLRQM